ncbi:cdc42 effector protein 2 [Hoplias malabaricus]|uniref:cdc42 effector protein 2 n=1 Tax=Hoplias malabaricus TaxID=27720 RepID=UPI00346181AE
MSAKAPIYLKRRSRKGKKEKLRDLLSSDMISPPLGDFRHTIHIGSGGGADDLFGDLSFLQGKFHLLPGQHGHQGAFQFSRTASVSAGHQPVSESSPLLKNALSLPVIGAVQALTLPAQTPAATVTTATASRTVMTTSGTTASTAALTTTSASLAPPPKPPRLHLESPHASLPASPNSKPRSDAKPEEKRGREEGGEEKEEEHSYLSHAGSLLSLHLDLGPSILEDVLEIMDGQRNGGGMNGGFTASGRQEIFT